jgi:hypothetical protein
MGAIAALADRLWLPMQWTAFAREVYLHLLDLRFERSQIRQVERSVKVYHVVGSRRPGRGGPHHIKCTASQLEHFSMRFLAYIYSEYDDAGNQARHDTSGEPGQITGQP